MSRHKLSGPIVLRDDKSNDSRGQWMYKNDIVSIDGESEDPDWIKSETPYGVKGWISHEFHNRLVQTDEEDPPWLTIAMEECKRGVREWKDPGENPRILEYINLVKPEYAESDGDEVDWCSAFVNWCFEQCDIKGTGKLNATSWLGFGGEGLATPRRGCVVVLYRTPDPMLGHVGFYIGETGNHVAVLGGNQSGDVMVSVQGFPKKDLRGYYWPSKEDYPGTA